MVEGLFTGLLLDETTSLHTYFNCQGFQGAKDTLGNLAVLQVGHVLIFRDWGFLQFTGGFGSSERSLSTLLGIQHKAAGSHGWALNFLCFHGWRGYTLLLRSITAHNFQAYSHHRELLRCCLNLICTYEPPVLTVRILLHLGLPFVMVSVFLREHLSDPEKLMQWSPGHNYVFLKLSSEVSGIISSPRDSSTTHQTVFQSPWDLISAHNLLQEWSQKCSF